MTDTELAIMTAIAEATLQGDAIIAERQAETARKGREAADKARAKWMAAWEAAVAQVAPAVPEWARPYMRIPDYDDTASYRYDEGDSNAPWRYDRNRETGVNAPIVIQLPGLAPIYAYERKWGDEAQVRFAVGVAEVGNVYADDDYDIEAGYAARFAPWRWKSAHDIGYLEDDFSVAVAQARIELDRMEDVEAKAERRTQELVECRASRAATPPTPRPTALERLAEALGDLIAERGWCDGGSE